MLAEITFYALYGKRDLCHGSKLTVLGMRGGNFATESSRVVLHFAWAR